MPQILNLELMKHPLNWVIVFLMTFFALVLLYIISPEQGTT